MTVSIAWLNKGNGYLVTDSAATVLNPKLTAKSTSVGEQQSYSKGVLEERAAKFTKVSHSTIGAVIGNAEAGLTALSKVKSLLKFKSIQEALEPFVRAEKKSITNEDFFQLLLIDHSAGVTTIWTVDQSDESRPVKRHYQDNEIIVLGSLNEEHKSSIKADIQNLCSIDAISDDPDHKLAVVISVLQAKSLRGQYAIQNVGGMFFGAIVRKGQIRYQKRLGYCFFSKKTDDLKALATNSILAISQIHNGIFLAWSTLTKGELKVFANDVNYKSDQKISKIMKPIMKKSKTIKLYCYNDFFSFVDKVTGAIAIIDRRYNNTDYMSIKGSSIDFEKALIQAIQSFPTSTSKPEEVPLMILGNKTF